VTTTRSRAVNFGEGLLKLVIARNQQVITIEEYQERVNQLRNLWIDRPGTAGPEREREEARWRGSSSE
jgi:hypothetical protein